MKRLICVFILSIAVVLLQAQGGKAVSPGNTVFHQLAYQMENVTGQITINGFVVTELQAKTGNGTATLNPWLIGENELVVELKKANPSKPAEFSFGLSELKPGDMVSTTDKGKAFLLEIKDKDFSANGRAQAARKFRSSLDFRQHLSEAERSKETDVLAYAQKFFSLFLNRDADGILRESEIKITDLSKAYGAEDMKAELRSYLVEELFKSKLNKLNPATLRAVRVGPAKTVWHIFNGKDELIEARSPDGSTMELPVYIGQFEGKLKVVR